MPSELYVQIPAGYGDLRSAAPGSPVNALMSGPDTITEDRHIGFLLNVHLQIVLYCKRWRVDTLAEAAMWHCAYPHRPAAAHRDILSLARAGFLEEREAGQYFVPAAADWPSIRVGTRDLIPLSVRKRVYERDAYRCVKCGSADDLTIDHIIPWSADGPDDEDNLQTLCGPCNSRKGARA